MAVDENGDQGSRARPSQIDMTPTGVAELEAGSLESPHDSLPAHTGEPGHDSATSIRTSSTPPTGGIGIPSLAAASR